MITWALLTMIIILMDVQGLEKQKTLSGIRDLLTQQLPQARGLRLGPPPAGGRQEGGSRGRRADWGSPVCPMPPSQPPPAGGRLSAIVCAPTLMTFLSY